MLKTYDVEVETGETIETNPYQNVKYGLKVRVNNVESPESGYEEINTFMNEKTKILMEDVQKIIEYRKNQKKKGR
jgi:hypothetical protein